MFFERMPMVIAILDRDLRFLRYNTTCVDFTRIYAPDTADRLMHGASYFDVYPGTEKEVLPLFEKTLAGENVQQEAVTLKTAGMYSYWDLVMMPIYEGGQIVGILYVSSDATDRVSALKALERTLTEYKHSQEELQHAYQTLEQRVDERTRQLTILLELSYNMTSTIELEPQLGLILDQLASVVEYDGASIFRLEGDILTVVAYRGPIPQEIALNLQYPLDFARANKAVIESHSPLVISDTHSNTPMARAFQATAGEQLNTTFGYIRSWMGVPLIVRDQVIGMLSLDSPTPNYYTPSHSKLALAFANQVAAAIENARLYENLRSMSERYRSLHQFNDRILQSAGVGIYAVDEHLRITSWNRKIEEMSGISADEALGRNLFALLPGLETEGFAVRLRRVLEVGAPEKLRLAHRNLMGELRFQKRRLAPLKEGERTTGVLVIVEDVTEFKRLLEQTVQSEKLAEVGRLSAGIAHEINNPLAVLSYAAQLLLREDLSADQKELAERIDSEVDRLKALTGGLLTFSSSRETRKRAVNLNEVLADVLRLVRYEFSRRSITLHEEWGAIPLLLADPNKLKQVFINLTINAAQAMKRGGTLTVKTERAAGGELVATVSDTGPGIPPAVRRQLFTPFFSTKREGEGTGLGLYICRTIVVEHGGRIEVESQEGEGCTFRAVLPPLEVPAT